MRIPILTRRAKGKSALKCLKETLKKLSRQIAELDQEAPLETRNAHKKNQWLHCLLTLSSIASVASVVASCSKSSDAPATTASGGSAGSAAVATAPISGYISMGTGSGSQSKPSFASKLGLGASAASASNSCTSGTFSGAYVGGGGSTVVSGSFSSGEFSVPSVEQKKELILTFTCGNGSSMRCLVKSGDAGVYCNPVADAVLAAFETALGKTIYDSSFSGKAIAKVGASIVQAAQNDGTATEAFNDQISTCQSDADKATCFKNAITASPFAGPFKLMQTMVNGWEVEDIFTLIADVFGGLIDVDTFIYSPFADVMETAFSTDFTTKARAFVAAVVADQLAGGSSYIVKVECSVWVSKYQSGGQIKYSPVMATVNGFSQPSCRNDAALLKNGLTGGQLTTFYTALGSSDGGYNVNLNDPSNPNACNNAWQIPGTFCLSRPNLSILSKYVEPNRNDPTGAQTGSDRVQPIRFGMINAFPEAQEAIMGAAATGLGPSCMSMGSNGPSLTNTAECRNWLAGVLADQKKNISGLMGLYMYLKNPADYAAGGDALLSLDQLHRIFVGSTLMNARLQAWAPGFSTRNAGNSWLPPVLAYSNGIYTFQDLFKWDSNAWSGAATTEAQVALLTTAYNASSVPYQDTFKMFERIPSQEEIRSYVFGSAHHEGWNPTGGKFFYASGKEIGTPGQGNIAPIFCKMTKGNNGPAIEVELAQGSKISCVVGSEAVDAEGEAAAPAGYPYALQERGWQGDDKGRTFALADRKTGMSVRPGNKEVLILQYHTGNPSECKTVAEKGTVVSTKVRYGWGSNTQEAAVDAYCMDMSSVATSGQISFYWGGSVEVSQSDGSGNIWKWNVPQVGRVSGSAEDYTILPVCYFAPSGHFTSDSQTGVISSSDATINGSGELTSLGSGGAAIDLCQNASNHSSKTRYYVTMMGGSAANKTDLKAYLMGSGGSAGSSILQWRTWSSAPGLNWDDLNLFIRPATLEAALAGISGGSPKVAPDTAPTFTMGVKLANQKYNAKFDPFCDDLNNNGHCDCKTVGSSTIKANPEQCTLEDEAAEPTLSNPPYWPHDANGPKLKAFFAACGGKGGTDLQTCGPTGTVAGHNFGGSAAVDGQYLNTNQLWMDTSEVFACQYLVTGEAKPRKPKFTRWDGFWKNHDGCPKANGSLVALDMGNQATTGGPVRLIAPQPMKNAYDVDRPNTLIKLINFATKTTGQGISLDSKERVFAFDEAMALIVLRTRIPADVPVYDAGTTTPSNSALRRDAFPYFDFVQTPGQDDGGSGGDPASGVLRGLTRPETLN